MPGNLDLNAWRRIYRGGRCRPDATRRDAVDAGAATVAQILAPIVSQGVL